jgi:hypothetical protein
LRVVKLTESCDAGFSAGMAGKQALHMASASGPGANALITGGLGALGKLVAAHLTQAGDTFGYLWHFSTSVKMMDS